MSIYLVTLAAFLMVAGLAWVRDRDDRRRPFFRRSLVAVNSQTSGAQPGVFPGPRRRVRIEEEHSS